jgi:hypothetical protein
MINIKRTFRQILKQWGHDVYVQRIQSNGNYSDKLERITARQLGQSGSINANSVQELDAGIFTKYDAVYYFESTVNPKEGDRIYESISVKINKNSTRFRIDTATPIRGRMGKVDYWIVGATREG